MTSKKMIITRPTNISVPDTTAKGPEAEYVRQLIEGRRMAEQEETPSSQPAVESSKLDDTVTPAIKVLFNHLAVAVNSLADNQSEVATLLRILYDEFVSMNTNMQQTNIQLTHLVSCVSGLVTHLVEHMERFAVMTGTASVTVSPMQQCVSATVKHPEPKMPVMKAHTCEIFRRDVCYGTSWEKITSKDLTPNECNWQALLKHMNSKRVTRGDTSPSSIIIFGWSATLRESQEIFYRLNPEKIFWICTYGLSHEAKLRLIDDITVKQGQLVVLLNKKDHRETAAGANRTENDINQEASKQCRRQGLSWWRASIDPHSGLDTNDFCYAMLTRNFSQDWINYVNSMPSTPKKEDAH